jgi:hypothetical protein
VKRGLLPGLILALGFVTLVLGGKSFPTDATWLEIAAVVLIGFAFIPLSIMVFHEREQS